MDLDKAFICRLLKEPQISIINEKSITPDMLLDDGPKALTFIMNFYQKHGAMPTRDTVELSIGEDLEEECPEPMEFYIDLVKTRWSGNRINNAIIKSGEALDKRDVESALAELKTTIKEIGDKSASISDIGLVDLRDTTQDRWDRYAKLKSLKGKIDGLPFPWPAMNDSTRGIHNGELWVIVARMKVGKCLREGTLVPDPADGRLYPIEEIVKQQRSIFTFSQEEEGSVKSEIPSQYWDNGIKECLRVGTRLGNLLEATTNEPLLTPDGWRHLETLKVGDKVAIPAKIPEPACSVPMDDDELLVLSALLAEGSCTGHHTSFSNFDSEFLEQFEETVARMDCSVTECSNGSLSVSGNRRGRYKNKVLNLTRRYNIRKLAKEKRVPPEVFSIPNSQLCWFLGHFWSCDGTIGKQKGSISIGLASEGMIDDLRHLLLRFGIVCKKRYKKAKRGGKEFDSWELSVRGQSKPTFVQEIGPYLLGGRKRQLSRIPPVSKLNDDAVRTTPHLRSLVESCMKKSGSTWKELWGDYGWKVGYRKSPGIRGLGIKSEGSLVPRAKFRFFLEWLRKKGVCGDEFNELCWIMSKEIAWDEIVSVEPIGAHQTYDLTVDSTHCYVAGGFIVHNSWLEIALCDHFFRENYRVLLATMEMSVVQMSTRFDSMFAKLPYGDFKCGKLDQHLEEKFAGSLQEWKREDTLPFWICGKGRLRTVQDLELLVEELQPDIVLIDGMYLMRTRGGKGSESKWEKVSTIADELQDLTQRKQIPIIASTQFNRKVTRKKIDAGSEDIGFSLEIAQNCHGLIGIFQTEEMRGSKELLLKLLEHREGEPVNMFLNWDFVNMDFSQKSIVTNEELTVSTNDDEDEGAIQY
jgi:intein/homing endonuclease